MSGPAIIFCPKTEHTTTLFDPVSVKKGEQK